MAAVDFISYEEARESYLTLVNECNDDDVDTNCYRLMRQKTCSHFFIPKEKKESPSAAGTHHVRCKHCNINYFEVVAEESSKFYEEYYKNKNENKECETKKTPEEKLADEKWKEQRLHIHVWDEIEGKRNHFKCIAMVTDWKTKRTGYEERIPCGSTLTLEVKT